MNQRLQIIFDHQEMEDRHLFATDWEGLVKKDFADPEPIIRGAINVMIKNEGGAGILFLQDTPIRVAADLSVRKHATCIYPYYHSHDFYELVYVCQGSCTQYMNGEREPVVMKPAEACLLAPGTLHALKEASPDDLILKFIIPEKDMLKLWEGESNTFVQKRSGLHFFRLQSDRRLHFEMLLTMFLEELYYGDKSWNPAVLHYLSLLFILLFRDCGEPVDELLYERVSMYVRSDLKAASLTGFAEAEGYSSGHISRMLRERTGSSFKDIVQRIRVEEGARLLAETNISVEQIAEMLGYANTSGFYKRFMHIYGLTPGAYRKIKESRMHG